MKYSNVSYEVMDIVKCPRLKKHAAIKIKPLSKAAPISQDGAYPGEAYLFTCESTSEKQTIRCLPDGKWNDIPHCPDTSNMTCPDLMHLQNGSYNATSPFKVGTIVSLSCDQTLAPDVAYNITGQRIIKCLPTRNWNHPMPTCMLVAKEPQNYSSTAYLFPAVSLILVVVILLAFIHLLLKWRKEAQQKARWKQYFNDYKHRHSRTSINLNIRPQQQQKTNMPVTDL